MVALPRIALLAQALAVLMIATAVRPLPTFAQAEDSPTWTIPPSSTEWDWLQLKSGEWLKGEILYMRDRNFRFESDELDELDIDLGDCRVVYLNRLSFLRLESGETPQGRGVLRGDRLEFETVDGRQLEIVRRDIISIVPGGDEEIDYWSFSIASEYGFKDGNTDQVDLSGRLSAHRRTATLRFLNDYRGIYGSQDGAKITNNHRATSTLDLYLTSRFYVTLPNLEYFQDEFKNVKHRVSTGAGLGYELVRNETFELDARISGGHQYQASDSGGEESNDFGVTMNVDFDIDFPGGAELDNSYRVQLTATDLDRTSHRFESILSVDIWGPMDLDLSFVFDRIEEPQPDSGGNVPEKNDFGVLAGLSIDF